MVNKIIYKQLLILFESVNNIDNNFIFFLGVVDKVEVKQKKATESDDVQNTFAFITISTDDRTLSQCLREFKEQQFHGRYLQVTVARENFLEKLKREREEAALHKEKKEDNNKSQEETIKATLPTIQTAHSSSSESSSDDSSEDESPPKQSTSIVKQNGSTKFKSSSESSESESESDDGEENLMLKKKSKIFLENGKVNHGI